MIVRVLYGICLACVCLSVSVLGIGDRALVLSYAKGYAITADNVGLEGVNKNPATLDFHSRELIANVNQSYGLDITHGFFGVGGILTDTLDIALTVPISQMGAIPISSQGDDDSATIEGYFDAIQMYPRLSIRQALLPKLSIGGSVMVVHEEVLYETATGYSADFGVLADYFGVRLGASVQNLLGKKTWSTGLEEALDMRMNIGASTDLGTRLGLAVDYSSGDDFSVLNMGASVDLSSSVSFHAGVRDMFETRQLRLGTSLALGMVMVNYSYGHHTVLEDSHKVGVTLNY